MNFKDVINKYLKKQDLNDEINEYSPFKTKVLNKIAGRPDGFAVRFLDPANKKRFAVAYPNKKDAEDKAAQLKRDGLKDITITQHKLNFKEDTPANATGTAVVGTGDDSSTVVVKKKKELQSKLMKRFKIKETIDRVIPDLFEEEDEITKRTNQLKELALKSEGAAVPKDKDTDQPKKYVAGLSDKEKKSHDRHLEKQGKKSDSDKSAYKQSPADKVAKTKPSKFTNKFKQMYGEETLDEVTAVKNKAKKSGMPYPILKKVYDRGMAAWKGGHRPGTTPQQWALARVNSFITKSPGTWGKADSDLAKQVKGS
tara:strand:+ start:1264 stop:2199 length:936 start_codon:yes stop_codon:yes gene_type:complete